MIYTLLELIILATVGESGVSQCTSCTSTCCIAVSANRSAGNGVLHCIDRSFGVFLAFGSIRYILRIRAAMVKFPALRYILLKTVFCW